MRDRLLDLLPPCLAFYIVNMDGSSDGDVSYCYETCSWWYSYCIGSECAILN
jgi:hypothetical protein